MRLTAAIIALIGATTVLGAPVAGPEEVRSLQARGGYGGGRSSDDGPILFRGRPDDRIPSDPPSEIIDDTGLEDDPSSDPSSMDSSMPMGIRRWRDDNSGRKNRWSDSSRDDGSRNWRDNNWRQNNNRWRNNDRNDRWSQNSNDRWRNSEHRNNNRWKSDRNDRWSQQRDW